MPFDLIEKGATAGGGGILGALLGFFGIKSKVDAVDKRMDKLSDVVQFKSTCDALHDGVKTQFDSLGDKIDSNHTDMKEDLKEILRKLP